jgi:hypothetical protein
LGVGWWSRVCVWVGGVKLSGVCGVGWEAVAVPPKRFGESNRGRRARLRQAGPCWCGREERSGLQLLGLPHAGSPGAAPTWFVRSRKFGFWQVRKTSVPLEMKLSSGSSTFSR